MKSPPLFKVGLVFWWTSLRLCEKVNCHYKSYKHHPSFEIIRILYMTYKYDIYQDIIMSANWSVWHEIGARSDFLFLIQSLWISYTIFSILWSGLTRRDGTLDQMDTSMTLPENKEEILKKVCTGWIENLLSILPIWDFFLEIEANKSLKLFCLEVLKAQF